MALPAVMALAARFPVQIHAPRWGRELYPDLAVLPRDAEPSGEIGVLFKPSFGAAWRWRRLPRRIGLSTALRGWLLTDPVPEPGGHRRLGYAAVAAALLEAGSREGSRAALLPLPGWSRRGAAAPLPGGAVLPVGLNPWSPSPTVRWPRFRALADELVASGYPVVFFCGPGEEAAVREIAGPHPLLAGLSLADFAATLQSCALFLSNDSGAAHFAAACGARVCVIHGSTGADRTGVGEPIQGPGRICQPCYRKSCPRGLVCLTDVTVAQVLASILGVLRTSPC